MPELVLTFRALAQCLEELERTSSRKQLTTAVALARLGGTKTDQQSIEDAYNRTSDLGLLGSTLWRGVV
jgi:hypothetical protein